MALDLLQKPLLTKNKVMFDLTKEHCEQAMIQLDRSLEFSEKIFKLLMNQPGHFPSQENLASYLGMSSRSFRRRFEKENNSYAEVLSKVKRDLAKRYLNDPKLTIEVIANLLQFSEPVSFRRAFKRWTGLTPSEYRKKQ